MAPGNEMQESSKFCLKWDGFHSNLTSVFENLRQGEELVDVTLCCEGMKLKAHKMMLSAASPFFRDLLQENPCQHPVFFLRDTRCQDMAAIIEFVYRGSVNVSQTQLASFIQTAELLQIRGLSGDEEGKQKESRPPSTDPVPTEPPPAAPPFRAHRQPASPQRHRAAPAAAPSGAGRPRATTPPVKRRRVSTTPPPPPPPPPPPVMAVPVEPPLAPQPEIQEAVVKQEKLEDINEVTVYDSGVPSSLEQMIFMPQPYPRAMTTSTLNVSSAPGAAAISSEDHSQVIFTCPECGAQYKSSYSLQQHARVHEGRTLCPVCGVTQSRVTNLRRHLMIRHNLSKERACEMVPLTNSGHWERAELAGFRTHPPHGADPLPAAVAGSRAHPPHGADPLPAAVAGFGAHPHGADPLPAAVAGFRDHPPHGADPLPAAVADSEGLHDGGEAPP